MFFEQEALGRVGKIPGDLLHPELVGTGRAAGEVDSAAGKFHDKQQIEGDQAVLGPDFDRGEVNASQSIPVRFEECFPARLRCAPVRVESRAP